MEIQPPPHAEKFAKNSPNMLAIAVVPFAVAMGISAWFLSPFLVLAQAALLVGALLIAHAGVPESKPEEQKPRLFSDEFRMVLERLDDALFVYDKDFRISFVNAAAEQLFGLSKADLVGKVLTPQDVENPRWKLLAQVAFPSLAPGMAARTSPGAYPQVVDLSFPDPFLEIRVTLLSLGASPEGTPLGFAKVIRDRTREVSLIKTKDEFVTIASHQLRTPTTGIHWALESLRKAEGLDTASKMLVEGAFGQSELLLKIIDDILGIAKIEEGRFGYAFQAVDLVGFLSKILGHALLSAKHTGVSLYFDPPAAKLPLVIADPQKLAMAVSNLVENAVRYNVKNGSVTVAVAPVHGEPFLEITVKDTGIGIPPEDLKKLFTKFFRAENALKLQTEGSGLGLYIAKNIIQAHGGKIWAESQLERGTIFHFTLATDQNRVPRHEVPLG